MGTFLIILVAFILVAVSVDWFAVIGVVGRPVDHKKWEQILQKHFDEGNYEYSYGMLSTSIEYYHKIIDKKYKDIPFISLSVSGFFIAGYIHDVGAIYRWSKLHKMIKAEIEKQKTAKYES
jgi:hypothetical protein